MRDGRNGAIADALAGPGYIVVDDFIDAALAAALADEARAADLAPAQVGTGAQRRAVPELRNDRTRWIEADTTSAAQRELLARLDALRLDLNRALFA